jgi:hypothetical protein
MTQSQDSTKALEAASTAELVAELTRRPGVDSTEVGSENEILHIGPCVVLSVEWRAAKGG